MKIVKKISCVIPFLMIGFAPVAQPIKDTIFYDDNWRICEQPIATYFRVGEINTGKHWYFINDVKDYYLNGQAEMTGHYSSAGDKDGTFVFYYPDGKIKKTGTFVNDTMRGIWSYYNANGILYCKINCENNRSFTPLFIQSPNGDTLLKEGSGKFSFKLKDFPQVFPGAIEHLVKGTCLQNKRIGEWEYDFFYQNEWRRRATERYDNGIFKNGSEFPVAAEEKILTKPAFIVDMSVPKLSRTENFVYDLVFADDRFQSSPQLANFLLHHDIPVFKGRSKKFEANVFDCLPLCAASIRNVNGQKMIWHQMAMPVEKKSGIDCWLLGYCFQTDDQKVLDQSDLSSVDKLSGYNGKISFMVDEEGYTSDIVVKGSINKEMGTHMGYYLSRLTNLAPKRENGKAVAAQQDFYLFTRVNRAKYEGRNFIFYRLLLSTKPEEQARDKFDISEFQVVKFGDSERLEFATY